MCSFRSQPDCLNYESNDYVKINCNDQNTCDLEEGVGPVPNGSCVMGIPLTEYKCVGPSRANVEECYGTLCYVHGIYTVCNYAYSCTTIANSLDVQEFPFHLN